MARNRKPAKKKHDRDAPGSAKAGRPLRQSAATDKPLFQKRDNDTLPPLRLAPAKRRLAEKTGLLLTTLPDEDYALLDPVTITPGEVAAAMFTTLENREKMGSSARERAEMYFCQDRWLERHSEIFTSLLRNN